MSQDTKAKFYMVMKSLTLQRQVPRGSEAQLVFVRNANKLESKRMLADSGFVQFDERVEMQTMIESDGKGGYKPKNAHLVAYLNDQVIGKALINLADFVKPEKRLFSFALYDVGSQGPEAKTHL